MKTAIDKDTIAALICELIETHIEKCDAQIDVDESPPHIIDSAAERVAMIEEISSIPGEHVTSIALTLDNGQRYSVVVGQL